MNRKVFAIILAAVMVLTMAACGSQEAEETTLTGMVVSLDGTTLSLVEMNRIDIPQGERPEGMENFQGFGGFIHGFPLGDGQGFRTDFGRAAGCLTAPRSSCRQKQQSEADTQDSLE